MQEAIFSADQHNFESLALEIFRYQGEHCAVYKKYLDILQTDLTKINKIADIPYLPIEFFKTFSVQTETWEPDIIFESSSTTGTGTSRHFVKNRAIYEQAFEKSFEYAMGNSTGYCHLALLPAYLERQHSSLVYQIDHFIKHSHFPESGFYLYNHRELAQRLIDNEKNKIPTILWGVTFALLDFAEQFSLDLKHTRVIETGGMKGRRKEIVREELHTTLMKAFGTDAIAGEYGMTELMSQAYSTHRGIYQCPPWVQVTGREINDPFTPAPTGKNAVLNVIDLSNIHSCCFLATADIARVYDNGHFEILGRLDNSDTRGCNLLI